mmetsp:Transcript_31298/g.58032  ORF Transcript_31298/g.58032 Transcript_31298/m.58032 type:complete len:332 (+) Transcript_31298:177-1172(+)
MIRRMAVPIAILSIPKLCDGFLHSMNIRVTRSVVQQMIAEKGDGGESDHSHRWKHEPFDFSSKFGWDNFYKKGLQHTDDMGESTTEVGDGDNDNTADTIESLEYEWHGHIPHSVVVGAIEPTISAASQYYSQKQPTSQEDALPSILLVGCGNSALPRVLHDAFATPVQVTCLDYSPVCIDMIKSMYESSCPNMDFVVGDATNLQHVQWEGNTAKESREKKQFDVIVDKGLMDALMCGEGFDLERLMGSVDGVLTHREWGVHVLICFQLSKASKQGLAEFGNSESNPSLLWDFDIPVEGSENGRACFNIAQRGRGQGTSGLGVDKQLTTEWI